MREDQWFQQDVATPQTSHQSLDWLRNHFGAKLISHKNPIVWAPPFPDLSPPDIFLWGHLKDRSYIDVQTTIDELEASITRDKYRIPMVMIRRLFESFNNRISVVKTRGGNRICIYT